MPVSARTSTVLPWSMCPAVPSVSGVTPGTLAGRRLRVRAGPGTLHYMEPGLSQLRRGVLEYCVLALLRQQERYGFELVRSLSAVDGLVTSEGTIYPLLTRLRKEELVTTFWQESASGPPRRYYRLTDAGGTALTAFSEEWTRFRDGVDALLSNGGRHDHDAA